mmetsp:Transcript_12782/g.18350  ORF Transcript_12782/g.18350 Transcript_12782/m.18350 type:complete len:353 (-) Transcript_12782:10-1068(-)
MGQNLTCCSTNTDSKSPRANKNALFIPIESLRCSKKNIQEFNSCAVHGCEDNIVKENTPRGEQREIETYLSSSATKKSENLESFASKEGVEINMEIRNTELLSLTSGSQVPKLTVVSLEGIFWPEGKHSSGQDKTGTHLLEGIQAVLSFPSGVANRLTHLPSLPLKACGENSNMTRFAALWENATFVLNQEFTEKLLQTNSGCPCTSSKAIPLLISLLYNGKITQIGVVELELSNVPVTPKETILNVRNKKLKGKKRTKRKKVPFEPFPLEDAKGRFLYSCFMRLRIDAQDSSGAKAKQLKDSSISGNEILTVSSSGNDNSESSSTSFLDTVLEIEDDYHILQLSRTFSDSE